MSILDWRVKMMILTGDKSPKISTGNDKYTEFKYAPPDFGLGVYHDKETGIDTYYHLLELDKIVGFIKKEFEPYNENKTVIEVELKVYNKELNTTNNYYINSVNEPRLEEMIQGLKDYGFTMSEGSVEECYYNYLGINMFGKFVWEKYERKN